MHVYAFGSIVRGQIDFSSDVDLLALVVSYSPNLDPSKYSIYSYKRMQELWIQGNPFAWHLSLEAKLLFSPDGSDPLADMGRPSPYLDFAADCAKFKAVIDTSVRELKGGSNSIAFEFSNIFLGIRNLATCYALGVLGQPIFERHSALKISENPLSIDDRSFSILERARLLSTRGLGKEIDLPDQEWLAARLGEVEAWADKISRATAGG